MTMPKNQGVIKEYRLKEDRELPILKCRFSLSLRYVLDIGVFASVKLEEANPRNNNRKSQR